MNHCPHKCGNMTKTQKTGCVRVVGKNEGVILRRKANLCLQSVYSRKASSRGQVCVSSVCYPRFVSSVFNLLNFCVIIVL